MADDHASTERADNYADIKISGGAGWLMDDNGTYKPTSEMTHGWPVYSCTRGVPPQVVSVGEHSAKVQCWQLKNVISKNKKYLYRRVSLYHPEGAFRAG